MSRYMVVISYRVIQLEKAIEMAKFFNNYNEARGCKWTEGTYSELYEYEAGEGYIRIA